MVECSVTTGVLVERGLDAQLSLSRGDFVLDVGIAISPGHTVALLGPNGAGKSTAVSALAGLRPLDHGRITLAGRTLDDPEEGVFVVPEDRRIGVVFQDYLLFPHLTVAQNVAFALRSRGGGRVPADEKTRSWLDLLGIRELSGLKPADLSGGQAQQVALARALIMEPDLLLLDEPLAALDATTRVEFRRVLADHLRDFPGPRLLITHDPTEAFLLADEIHVIEGGSVTQVGAADDIRLRPRTAYIADLAGSNLLEGEAADGVVKVGVHRLSIADSHLSGPVLATVHPRAIALYRSQPEGSPRNTWEAAVSRIEHYGDRVRLQTGPPLALTVEITPEAVNALDLRVGSQVWLSVKATEIGLDAR